MGKGTYLCVHNDRNSYTSLRRLRWEPTLMYCNLANQTHSHVCGPSGEKSLEPLLHRVRCPGPLPCLPVNTSSRMLCSTRTQITKLHIREFASDDLTVRRHPQDLSCQLMTLTRLEQVGWQAAFARIPSRVSHAGVRQTNLVGQLDTSMNVK